MWGFTYSWQHSRLEMLGIILIVYELLHCFKFRKL